MRGVLKRKSKGISFALKNYFAFLALLIAAFCFFFLLTLGFSYCSCFLKSPTIPSFWHFLLNLLIALSTFSFSPTLTVDNFIHPLSFNINSIIMFFLNLSIKKLKFLLKKAILRLLKYEYVCD